MVPWVLLRAFCWAVHMEDWLLPGAFTWHFWLWNSDFTSLLYTVCHASLLPSQIFGLIRFFFTDGSLNFALSLCAFSHAASKTLRCINFTSGSCSSLSSSTEGHYYWNLLSFCTRKTDPISYWRACGICCCRRNQTELFSWWIFEQLFVLAPVYITSSIRFGALNRDSREDMLLSLIAEWITSAFCELCNAHGSPIVNRRRCPCFAPVITYILRGAGSRSQRLSDHMNFRVYWTEY